MASYSNSAPIVQDGLVWLVDPENPKSYPGSGTALTDLTGNQPDGTLLNGVGYNGKALVYDGIDDRVGNLNVLTATTHSVFMWCKLTTFNKVILGMQSTDYVFYLQNGGLVYHKPTGGNFSTKVISPALVVNEWFQIGLTRNNSVTWTLYINGVNKGTSNLPSNLYGGISAIGAQAGGGFRMGGETGEIGLYNTYLNDAEMLQNYNALKHKY